MAALKKRSNIDGRAGDRANAARQNGLLDGGEGAVSSGEYIATFASILVGLAAADLAISFHRLMRSRSRIRWDWLPLAAALLVLLTITSTWWRYYPAWMGQPVFGFAEFMPYLFILLLLFLLSAAALPDELPDGEFDLGAYYMGNRLYFWSLISLYAVVVVGLRTATKIQAGVSGVELLRSTWDGFVVVGLAALLMLTSRRWVHGAVLLFMLSVTLFYWIDFRVGS